MHAFCRRTRRGAKGTPLVAVLWNFRGEVHLYWTGPPPGSQHGSVQSGRLEQLISAALLVLAGSALLLLGRGVLVAKSPRPPDPPASSLEGFELVTEIVVEPTESVRRIPMAVGDGGLWRLVVSGGWNLLYTEEYVDARTLLAGFRVPGRRAPEPLLAVGRTVPTLLGRALHRSDRWEERWVFEVPPHVRDGRPMEVSTRLDILTSMFLISDRRALAELDGQVLLEVRRRPPVAWGRSAAKRPIALGSVLLLMSAFGIVVERRRRVGLPPAGWSGRALQGLHVLRSWTIEPAPRVEENPNFGVLASLWRMMTAPDLFFGGLPRSGDVARALRFRVLTALVPSLAITAMLFFRVGLGVDTAEGLEHLQTKEIALAAFTLIALPALGIGAVIVLARVAHAILPPAAGPRAATVTVLLFAFGIRAASFVPGFEIPTLIVALSLSIYGLSRRPGVTPGRASLAVGIGAVPAAMLMLAGLWGILLLEWTIS
jgi:hypothetical protein